MHMADALISPTVGAAGWAVAGGFIIYSSAKVKKELDEKRVPLMGVLAAFVFAAQMINFTIPMTGSSGHLGGALLLSVILGPYAGFIAIASVLTVQAFFFADGGILALGCNIFNIGVISCFIAYPFVYRSIAGEGLTKWRIATASIVAGIAALQMGAFGVVTETYLSGVTELSFGKFLLLMQPIHLAIGIVEGLVTAGVVLFLAKFRHDIISDSTSRISFVKVAASIALVTCLTAGVFSLYASGHPDGLEWSLEKSELVEKAPSGIYAKLESIQEKTSILPDYSFKSGESTVGTSTAGIAGSIITLMLVFSAGFVFRKKH